jgi:RNA recognition motif-containing protein
MQQAELQAEDFLSQILLGSSKVNEGSSKVNDELESLQEHAQRMQRVEQNEEERDFRINNVIDPARDSNKKLTQIQPQHDPGIPNSSIIIHGLNYATTQESLYLALKESGAKVDSVRLVLDKPTLKSRGFAFCHFYSERFAMEFVTAQVSQGGFILDDFITRIEYCRERSGGGGLEERADWHCFECASKNFEKRVFCFRCGLEKSASDEKTKEVEEMDKVNGGVRDIGSVPFPILLFRELDPLTTEDAIWQNTLLVCKPTSIWLVKDRKSRRSLGHCFISFPSIEMANKLLNKMFKGKEPKPFYIENKMIQVSYAHMGSFIPSSKPSPFACFYEENVIGSPGMYSSYWDSSAFCRPFPHDQVDSRIPPLPSK